MASCVGAMTKIRMTERDRYLYEADRFCPWCNCAPLKKIEASNEGYTDFCPGHNGYMIVKKTVAYVER